MQNPSIVLETHAELARREAGEALARSERELADFFDNASIGLHWVGPDGIILRVNQAELDMLGYTREEYVGRHIAEFHADQRVIEDILARLTRGERLTDYPARLRHKDGQIRDVLINSSVLFENGEFIHTRCFTHDITERKQAERALRESQAQIEAELADTRLLQQVSAAMIAEDNVQAIYEKIIDAAMAIMRSGYASMQMLYPGRGSAGSGIGGCGGELRLLAFRGFNSQAASFWEWVRADSQSTCGEALRKRQRVIAANLEQCEYLAGSDDLATYLQTGIRACQTTPLLSRDGALVGMISTHWNKPHQPTERDLRLLDILARQAADLIERKRAEEQIGRSAELLTFLVDRSPSGFYVVDSNFCISHINADSQARAFRNVVPAIGRRLDDAMRILWPEPLATEIINIFRHTLDTGEPYRSPGLVSPRHDLDAVETYEWQLDRITMPDGTYSVVCYYYDTTRLREAEQALRQSEERFRMLADNMAQLAWTCDSLGNCTWYNQRWLDYTGLTFDDMQGWGWQQVQHPDHVDRVVASVTRSRESGEVWEDTFPLRGKDGQYRWFLSRAIPIRDAEGNILRWFGTNTDVTEQLEAEKSASRLAAIVSSSEDAIVSKDLNGIVTSWNRGAERLFGYTAEEAVGMPVTLLIPEDHLNEEPEILARIRRGEPVEHYETVRRRKDGTLLDISLTVSPMRDETGRVIGASKVARDITARVRLAKQTREQAAELLDLHRRKDEFLAMLSHELRNPLAPIANAVQLLRLEKEPSPIQEQARTIIERQVGQLTRLIEDLMEVSRMSTGRIHLNEERLDLRGVVGRAVDTVRPLIAQRRHAIVVSLGDAPIWLFGDAGRLEQVVVNLLTNAAKYTDEAGHIWLGLEQVGEEAVLRVRDTGVGIAPDLLPRIFDLFTQGERSLDRAQGGLGVGLALVRQIVQLHRGRVEASSVVGQGSEFIVRLPVVPAPTSSAQVAAAGPAESTNGRCRVLVVDDNVDCLYSMKMLLAGVGHEVATASDGPAALEALSQFAPRVVLLDIGIPEIDGFEVARRIRAEKAHHGVLLIATTGYGQEVDRQRSREAGIDHHLVKPLDFKKVQELLAMAEQRPQAS